MANCNSCNGGCQSCTRMGALNSLSRAGYRYPYYTGSCPPAPCTDSCGNACTSGCSCRRNASVTDAAYACNGSCGCGGCSARNGSCGCAGCSGCNGSCGCAGCSGCNGSCGCSGSSGCNGSCGCAGCSGCNGSCGQCARNAGYLEIDGGWECSACGTMNCGTDSCSNCGNACSGCHDIIHGAFTADGPLNLSAGGSVNFEPHCSGACNFSVSYGGILIRHPGLYYVNITADIPKNAAVDTVMRLELDGRIITPPEIAIATDCSCGTSNYSGCAIIRACTGSVLKLVTLRDLCIETTTAQPVFTLWIMPVAHGCHA